MARRGGIKHYAMDFMEHLRAQQEARERLMLPAIDLADVVSTSPTIRLAPHGTDIIYEDDDLMYQIDPETLQVGEVVVLGRDSTQQPIVLGLSDGNNEDPFATPQAAELRDSFLELQANVKQWKASAQTFSALPLFGNTDGDLRLVVDEGAIYAWISNQADWVQVSGAGGGDFLELSGGTLTGDLVMGPDTRITLTESPTDPLHATNKDYVDTEVAAAVAGGVVPVEMVSADYTVLGTDRVILVNATSAPVTISIPTGQVTGTIFEVKDRFGAATTNNIIITSVGSETFDGQASVTLTTNYQSITLVSDGTNWSLI